MSRKIDFKTPPIQTLVDQAKTIAFLNQNLNFIFGAIHKNKDRRTTIDRFHSAIDSDVSMVNLDTSCDNPSMDLRMST
jgi:hypothetical protein